MNEALRSVSDARVGATVRTTANLQSAAEPIRVHPSGSDGLVVAFLGPGVYLVEIRVPDATLAGGAWHDTLELRDSDFELAQEIDHGA
jgi:hypothetical protein